MYVRQDGAMSLNEFTFSQLFLFAGGSNNGRPTLSETSLSEASPLVKKPGKKRSRHHGKKSKKEKRRKEKRKNRD